MSRSPSAAADGLCGDRSCSEAGAVTDPRRCPESQSVSPEVSLLTVKALLGKDALRRLDGSAYRFCGDPGCDVVYFDNAVESVFRRSDLRTRVGLKETEDPVPICYCFDVTLADVRQEIATRGTTEVPAMVAAEVQAGHCACEVRNPQGSCCLGNLSRAVKAIESETGLETLLACTEGC